MDIAKKQVEDGAHIIDVNLDEGMLDGLAAMQKFIKIAVTEPEVSKRPFMIDSSKFEIVEAGLKWCQGKPIINSISLKVGEEKFIEHAILVRKHGAAVVIMAFDEQGQAATEEEKVRICKRSYDILVGPKVNFPPEDIVFDPNILTIGTGMEEHCNYGIDFIKATKTIKEICPHVKISGGVSNLSFGFRGVNVVRESIHAVFLHQACLDSGMDMGIVNSAEMLAIEDLEPHLLSASLDLVFNKNAEATDKMLEVTTYEKSVIEAKKANKPKPRIPRNWIDRKERTFPGFDWEKITPQPATEAPLPIGDAAKNKVPNPYKNTALTHPKIIAVRERAAKANALGESAKIFGDSKVDYAQDANLYPKGFPHYVRGRDSLRSHITKSFQSRMNYYDGAMGTMIQKHTLEEEDFRADRFKDFDCLIKGNNDLLSMTKPDIISQIYTEYLESGSDMIGTNTFSCTTIAQADYKMENLVYELNYVGARLARDCCDKITAKDPTNPRFVVGAIGPTNRTASISPDVEDSACRNCTFDELVEAYYEQVVGLMDGGADLLIVETIFDTLNAKAALFAIGEYLEHSCVDVPVFVSGTLVDQSGRTLSGQTGEAFYNSIRHSKPMCVGLNCALGAKQMAPFLKKVADAAECFVHVYSNAGLPNAMGGYDDTPEDMAKENLDFCTESLVNMIGGCCGSTPPHIKAIREATSEMKPRPLPALGLPKMWLSGLEDLIVDDVVNSIGLPFLNA